MVSALPAVAVMVSWLALNRARRRLAAKLSRYRRATGRTKVATIHCNGGSATLRKAVWRSAGNRRTLPSKRQGARRRCARIGAADVRAALAQGSELKCARRFQVGV